LVLGTTLHGLDQDLWGESVNVCSRNLKVKPPPDLRFYSIRWSSFIQIVGGVLFKLLVEWRTAIATQAGCPNNNWAGVNPTLTVTSITLSIQQPPGEDNEIFNCTASDPNGLSSPVALTC
jgi:hypothetical protein